MKLQDKQIFDIVKGAVVNEECNGLLCFNRLPKEIVNYYASFEGERHIRATSTSGVRLDFISDTEWIKITYRLFKAASQPRGAFDIWVNGEFYTSVGDNLDDGSERSIETVFEKGEKHITVYLPCLSRASVSSMEISDGAFITPAEDKPLALFFGDSITQGYTSSFPSLTYVSRVAEHFGWDFYNFGIGADIYNSEIPTVTVDRTPEIVFTSYGTNDWSTGMSAGALKKNMREYYNILCEKYPTSRLVAILPIWRDCFADNRGDVRTIGKFDELFPFMRDVLREFPRVEIIDGRELVPHANGMYADAYLHPNETGYEFYAARLCAKMSK